MVFEGFDGMVVWVFDLMVELLGIQLVDVLCEFSLCVEVYFFWSLFELFEVVCFLSFGKVEIEFGEFFELYVECDDVLWEVWLIDLEIYLLVVFYMECWDWEWLCEICFYFDDWCLVEGVFFFFIVEDEFSLFYCMQCIEIIEVNVELDVEVFVVFEQFIFLG